MISININFVKHVLNSTTELITTNVGLKNSFATGHIRASIYVYIFYKFKIISGKHNFTDQLKISSVIQK